MRFSPTAICLTVLLHCGFFLFASTILFRHTTTSIVTPITSVLLFKSIETIQPKEEKTLEIPVSDIANKKEQTQQLADEDRYYLPDELSRQVSVLYDGATELNIPIRQIVILAIYINEAGTVDNVVIEEKGLLSEDEEEQLKSAFQHFLFLPGMRAERVVKALYRIQLEINRRTTIRQ